MAADDTAADQWMRTNRLTGRARDLEASVPSVWRTLQLRVGGRCANDAHPKGGTERGDDECARPGGRALAMSNVRPTRRLGVDARRYRRRARSDGDYPWNFGPRL